MSDNGSLVKVDAVLMPDTLDGTLSIAQHFAKSGFFQDSRDASQAIVKILAGRELGFGPFASMTGIHIIKGRIGMSANLMAAAIKRSGRYRYKVMELTDAVCRLEFYEGTENLGPSRFSMEDAKRAKLAGGDNYQNYPRNMLFARAMSNGARWYCADVFGGPVYTQEELDDLPDEAPPPPKVVTPETIAERIAANTVPEPEQVDTPHAERESAPSYDPWGAIHMVQEIGNGKFSPRILSAYFGDGITNKSKLEAFAASDLDAFKAGYDRLRADYKAGKSSVAVPS